MQYYNTDQSFNLILLFYIFILFHIYILYSIDIKSVLFVNTLFICKCKINKHLLRFVDSGSKFGDSIDIFKNPSVLCENPWFTFEGVGTSIIL